MEIQWIYLFLLLRPSALFSVVFLYRTPHMQAPVTRLKLLVRARFSHLQRWQPKLLVRRVNSKPPSSKQPEPAVDLSFFARETVWKHPIFRTLPAPWCRKRKRCAKKMGLPILLNSQLVMTVSLLPEKSSTTIWVSRQKTCLWAWRGRYLKMAL